MNPTVLCTGIGICKRQRVARKSHGTDFELLVTLNIIFIILFVQVTMKRPAGRFNAAVTEENRLCHWIHVEGHACKT